MGLMDDVFYRAGRALNVLDYVPILPPSHGRMVKRYGSTGFDPRINRHTGKPHEHKREIARRLRQQAQA